MSGLFGHISHLHEDFSLSFGKIEEICKLATENKLNNTTEKTDGQNVYFSFDIINNKIKFARNKTDIINKGLVYNDLLNKWKNVPKLQEAYCKAYVIFSKAFSTISSKKLESIFGNNSNIWYSVEIIYSKWPNVINYNRNILAIHRSGTLFSDTGDVVENFKKDNFSLLCSLLGALNTVAQKLGWTIMGPINISLLRPNKNYLCETLNDQLDVEISKYQLNNNNTISDYVANKFVFYIQGYDGNINKTDLLNLSNLFVNINISNLKRRKLAAQIKNNTAVNNLFLSKNRDKIIKKICVPIENIIHNFSVELLRDVHSTIALEPQKEIERLKTEISKEINKFKQIGTEQDINFLNYQLNKLKSIMNINSSVEGIVFEYNNKIYKFTGNFAVINQILGYYRYK